ncbi:MAG: diguanylate cyclase [Clostridia bacterium]|nr:diguanylate cyclase [Clostridia bacterium]
MRIFFSITFVLLVAALAVCCYKAHYSHKAIGRTVAMLEGALIPPVIGNLLIIASTQKTLSTIGCYIYFLGMDSAIYALLLFSLKYCQIGKKKRKYKLFAEIPLVIDVVQMLCNPFFHHAFETEPILVAGADYYRLLPYLGQTYHRVVDYGILAAVIVIFIVKMVRSARIEAERYFVILAALIITAAWETAYIFSRTPMDRAMIGFAVFGILVYYLSLFYRPLRLLDSMLANMASEMPEALFFFDATGHCIWANKPGIALAEIEKNNFEPVPDKLRALFGDYQQDESMQREVTAGKTAKSYVLENHSVTDDRQRPIGSFLSVRDNTEEQKTLRREIHKAMHDSLTGLYNRAGYDLLINSLDLKTTYLLLIDLDCFKAVNDTYGHETGDKVLKKTAEIITSSFRADDCACRIGGDEFVVFMVRTGEQQKQQIINRVNQMNDILGKAEDGLPAVSISVGVAHGRNAANADELFEHADQALYQTKHRGKKGYTFYSPASA